MKLRFALSEVFPIQTKSLPMLSAYRVEVGRGESYLVGGKLAYRLMKQLGGHWVWADYRILTDHSAAQADIDRVVEQSWSAQPDVYQHLERVQPDKTWKPTPNAIARFVANGLSRDYEHMMKQLLSKERIHLGSGYIDRMHIIRAQVAQDSPAISVSVASRLVHKQDLHEYAMTLTDPEDLVGLWVADKNGSFKGEILGVVGPLKDHRDRLVQLTQNEDTIMVLQESADDTLIVRVGRNQYDYAATCLQLLIHMDYMHRFGINRSDAMRHLRIAPEQRHKMVTRISALLRMNGLIGFEYDSHTRADLFMNAADIGLDTGVRLGGDAVVPYDKSVMTKLKQNGLYRLSTDLDNDSPIRMGVVMAPSTPDLAAFYDALRAETDAIGLDLQIVMEVVSSDQSRAELERAIDRLETKNPHIILGVFPEGLGYYIFKSLTVSRGLPSQLVRVRTLGKWFAVPNIVLGILGKMGNVPYVLAKPLPYADIIVGIDIARERKTRLTGSINVAAIARIYFSNGEFVRYMIHDEPIEGETVPVSVLQSMFPANEFESRRVIVHRDGFFRGDERKTLHEWARAIGAKIHTVEVIKSGQPRLYEASEATHPPRGICQATKGTALRLSSQEAILVSTPPPFKGATAQPLRIRSDRSLSIEKAVNSVLSLTLLHYGSTSPPRLPVTIHYSDQIAKLALRGVKPKNLEGSAPYWL